MLQRAKELTIEYLDPEPLLELFLLTNIAGVGLDIYVAHAVNDFKNRWEWAPIYFSAGATVVYLISLALTGPWPRPVEGRPRRFFRGVGRMLGFLVGLASVVVGIAGLIFHLQSRFFQEQTIHSLVFTAPFAAPLAYAGIGLLIMLNRARVASTIEWGRWVVALTMGGFLGNFVLCLCDHAQNAFFDRWEWTGVIAGAAGVGILTAVFLVYDNKPLIRLALAVMALEIVVGLAGFAFHVLANLANPMTHIWDKFVYGTPAFAPMLFADIASLAALGLWALYVAVPEPVPEALPRGVGFPVPSPLTGEG